MEQCFNAKSLQQSGMKHTFGNLVQSRQLAEPSWAEPSWAEQSQAEPHCVCSCSLLMEFICIEICIEMRAI